MTNFKDFLEPSPYSVDKGELIGKNPRDISKKELIKEFGSKSVVKRVRAKCLDCCVGDASEVRKCISVDCPLWPLRMGSNVFDSRQGRSTPAPKAALKAKKEKADAKGRT